MQAEFCQLLGQLVAGPGEHARVQQSCAGTKRERGAYLLQRSVLVAGRDIRRARSTDFAAC